MNTLKKVLILSAVLFASATATAHEGKECPLYFAQSDLCASLEFTQAPNQYDESKFLVKIYQHGSTAESPVMADPTEFKVDLWMEMGNHGGHGTAPVKIVKQDLGIYFVSEAYFVMPGRWLVRVSIDGERRNLNVDVKP